MLGQSEDYCRRLQKIKKKNGMDKSSLVFRTFSVLSLQLKNYGDRKIQTQTYQIAIPLVVIKIYDTGVNGSHNDDNPLLKPTGMKIATNLLPGPTTQKHRKLIRFKTISLCTNCSTFYLECCQFFGV